MKFRKVRVYDFDADEACDYLIERELGYDLTELENVTTFKKIKRTDDGKVRKDKDEWCAHAQLPKVLQAVIPPKALTWYGYGEWHRATKTLYFSIEPIVMRGKVDCKGRTVFKGDEKNRFVRDFEMELTVRLPVVGHLAESFIIDVLKKNEEQDHEKCSKILKKLATEKTAV
jgi:hypothetical protein